MTSIFKSLETVQDKISVRGDQDHVQITGRDPEGADSKIFVSASDAIALANAILKHYGVK